MDGDDPVPLTEETFLLQRAIKPLLKDRAWLSQPGGAASLVLIEGDHRRHEVEFAIAEPYLPRPAEEHGLLGGVAVDVLLDRLVYRPRCSDHGQYRPTSLRRTEMDASTSASRLSRLSCSGSHLMLWKQSHAHGS